VRRKELALAAVISSAIAVAILSMPDVLRPAAESLLRALGLYWPAAVLLIGVIHGLKPDEHTWPITVSYGMMQESLGKAMISTGVFAGALTLVWASLSALTSQVLSFFQGEGLEAYVDIVVGLTMVTVAGALLTLRRGHGASGGGREARADYKVIWVHGVAAAFGGDFFIVFYTTVILLPVMPASMGFAVGLLFGLGSWAAQSAVVAMMYKGLIKAVRDVSLLTSAGRLSLLFLGVFMIGLGVFSLTDVGQVLRRLAAALT
jgi:threonine/homoserine/homoserine lactone efflux protein